MIHLDGETYIDTSLISCAEYQAFLDEQSTYGSFLQPDHWKKSSFPSGQGHAPVLGVRPSDALAFCTWLTKRSQGVWQYRLPTRREQKILEEDKDLNATLKMGTGYWIEKGKAFAWTKNVLPDPDFITNVILGIFENVHVHARISDLNNACNNIRFSAIDLEGVNNVIQALQLENILQSSLNRAYLLQNARFFNPRDANSLSRKLEINSDSISSHTSTLKYTLKIVLDRAQNRTYSDARSSNFKRAINYTFELGAALERALPLDIEDTSALKQACKYWINIAVTLAMIIARIEGKLPGWEGILLVRERI